MFLIIVRISRTYLFLACLVRINVVPSLEPLISNSKMILTRARARVDRLVLIIHLLRF
jgi:hypothetical protein